MGKRYSLSSCIYGVFFIKKMMNQSFSFGADKDVLVGDKALTSKRYAERKARERVLASLQNRSI